MGTRGTDPTLIIGACAASAADLSARLAPVIDGAPRSLPLPAALQAAGARSDAVLLLSIVAPTDAECEAVLAYSTTYDGPILVATTLDLLDGFYAAMVDTRVRFMVEPDGIDLMAGLVELREHFGQRVREDRSDNPLSLHRITAQLADVARALALVADGAGGGLGGPVRDPGRSYDDPRPGTRPPVTARAIRDHIKQRRLRDAYFARDLFADPAWDILLDLTAARLEGQRVSVSSLCIAAAVPPTTALRWIRAMTDNGLLERQPDPIDARRVFIGLSDTAYDGMLRYFAASGALG